MTQQDQILQNTKTLDELVTEVRRSKEPPKTEEPEVDEFGLTTPHRRTTVGNSPLNK